MNSSFDRDQLPDLFMLHYSGMIKNVVLVACLALSACLSNGQGTLPPEPQSSPADEKCYPEPGYNYYWNEGG